MTNSIDFPYFDLLENSLETLSRLAFQEDLPAGDITANVLNLDQKRGRANIICREEVIMCGTKWYPIILKTYMQHVHNGELDITAMYHDGEKVSSGSVLFKLYGKISNIVGIERTFLNFLTRAIGIASITSKYVEKIGTINSTTEIFDTRKTLPGYRYFDKYSVRCGKGKNHRFNLSEMALFKENHFQHLSSISDLIENLPSSSQVILPFEIEVENLHQYFEALQTKAPLILLDNFTPKMIQTACKNKPDFTQVEVSGGINLDNILDYLHPKLDRISIGALTHSVKAPDLSLLIEEEKSL